MLIGTKLVAIVPYNATFNGEKCKIKQSQTNVGWYKMEQSQSYIKHKAMYVTSCNIHSHTLNVKGYDADGTVTK